MHSKNEMRISYKGENRDRQIMRCINLGKIDFTEKVISQNALTRSMKDVSLFFFIFFFFLGGGGGEINS